MSLIVNFHHSCPHPTPQGDLWYFIDDGPLFDSLPAVIDHYMMFVDGLPTLLRYPVPIPGSSRPNPNRAVSVLLSVMCDCMWSIHDYES